MEVCCLVETFPVHHVDAADYQRTLKFAYLYGKTVTLLPTHCRRTNSIMLRNRRIGLSQSGIVQAFEKFGRRAVLRDFCDAGYRTVCHWDKIYSDWLCCSRSIKKTSVKPSGTVSLLAGVTPGVHYQPTSSRSFWRNVRVAANSALLERLREAGYLIMPDHRDQNTVVVRFGVYEPNVRAIGEVSIWQQLKNAVDYQRFWADNQVSCTVQFRPEEADTIAHALQAYEDELKGISFLPINDHGYEQAPYEPVSAEQVQAYLASLRPIVWEGEPDADASATKFCDAEICTLS
jgi:hypothetical protein